MTQALQELIALTGRSKDLGDGWRQVSDTLFPWIQIMVNRYPDVFELDVDKKRLRLKD